MDINMWFFLCVKNWSKVLLRIPEGTGTTWKN